jgi:hypothetical protein
MAYQFIRIGAAASAIVAAGLLAACNNVASMSCDRIASEAKDISQRQQVKINSITNLREVSRTEAEARCQGNAAWSDNTSTDIYLRAYEQSGNTMVAYSDRGFDSAAPAAQGAPPQQAPPAQGVPGYDQPAQPQGGENRQ